MSSNFISSKITKQTQTSLELGYQSFMVNFLLHLKLVFDYKGKEDLKSYWLFSLAEFLFMMLFFSLWFYIFFLIGDPSADYSYQGYKEEGGWLGVWLIVAVLVLLYFFLVNLAASVRRLRDAGCSGLWVLLVFIPLLNFLLLPFLLLPTKVVPRGG